MNAKTNAKPTKVTAKMARPSRGMRLKTGLKAGYEDGGIVHTDNWREGQRR
jgi:hypothetical protein